MGLSLSEIRAQLREVHEEDELRRWCGVLRSDSRSGARVLLESCERRLEAIRAEALRMERLFAMRARLVEDGAETIAGVDEVGVGPLAGPVVAAAVVLPRQVVLPGLNDSKQLTQKARERLDAAIRGQALGWAVAAASPAEIDRMNIYRASLLAMQRAVHKLSERLVPDHVLVDARTIPGIKMAQTALPHGDAEDGSIAAASIVAKVHRDAWMRQLDREHPGYGFARHMGYGTPIHLRALEQLGPSPIHRRSFSPVAQAVARELRRGR